MPSLNNLIIKSYLVENIPKAVNGVIPSWATIVNRLVTAYNKGVVITYVDENNQLYICEAVTSTEFRFYGRTVPNYPNNTSATMFFRTINRSTGAVTNHTMRFNQTAYT